MDLPARQAAKMSQRAISIPGQPCIFDWRSEVEPGGQMRPELICAGPVRGVPIRHIIT
jgi:hypothetical protein